MANEPIAFFVLDFEDGFRIEPNPEYDKEEECKEFWQLQGEILGSTVGEC
jgi:hypothetical protein